MPSYGGSDYKKTCLTTALKRKQQTIIVKPEKTPVPLQNAVTVLPKHHNTLHKETKKCAKSHQNSNWQNLSCRSVGNVNCHNHEDLQVIGGQSSYIEKQPPRKAISSPSYSSPSSPSPSRSAADASTPSNKTDDAIITLNHKTWADRVAPKTFSEIKGNRDEIDALHKWIKKRKEGEDTKHIVALIYGRPGVGKTTTAHLLLKECGFAVSEFNVSLQRSKDKIYTQVRSLLERKPMNGIQKGTGVVSNSESKDELPNAIILDEIDGSIRSEKEERLQVESLNQKQGLTTEHRSLKKKTEEQKQDQDQEYSNSHKTKHNSTDINKHKSKLEFLEKNQKKAVVMGAVDAVIDLVQEAEEFRNQHGRLPRWGPIICVANEKSSRTMRILAEYADVYHFKPLSDANMVNHIKKVAKLMMLPLTDQQSVEIRKQAHGDARNAVTLLELLLTSAYAQIGEFRHSPLLWENLSDEEQWKYMPLDVQWNALSKTERASVLKPNQVLWSKYAYEKLQSYGKSIVQKLEFKLPMGKKWQKKTTALTRWHQLDVSVQWRFIPDAEKTNALNVRALRESSHLDTTNNLFEAISILLFKYYNADKQGTKQQLVRVSYDGLKKIFMDPPAAEFQRIYMQDVNMMRLMLQENILQNYIRPCGWECAEALKKDNRANGDAWSRIEHKSNCTIEFAKKFSRQEQQCKQRTFPKDIPWYNNSVFETERRLNKSVNHVSEMLDVMSDIDILTSSAHMETHISEEMESIFVAQAVQEYRWPTTSKHWSNGKTGNIKFTQFFDKRTAAEEIRGHMKDFTKLHYYCCPHHTTANATASISIPSFEMDEEDTHNTCTCLIAKHIRVITEMDINDIKRLCVWCQQNRLIVCVSNYGATDIWHVMELYQKYFIQPIPNETQVQFQERMKQGEAYFGKSSWEYMKKWKPISEQFEQTIESNNQKQEIRIQRAKKISNSRKRKTIGFSNGSSKSNLPLKKTKPGLSNSKMGSASSKPALSKSNQGSYKVASNSKSGFNLSTSASPYFF